MIAKTYESPGNHPCRAAQCKTCPLLMATEQFTNHKIGQVFKMKFAAFCKSSNIVYLITCRRCGQQYVGETGQPLHLRINIHCSNITQKRTEESPVAELFNGEGHTLRTSHPFGMNLRVECLWNLPHYYLWNTWNSTSPIDAKATRYPKKW